MFKLWTCCFIIWCVVRATTNKGPYETLGLKRNTSKDMVKKAFRKLSLQYHPDKNPDPRVEGKYKQITDAYQTIVDDKADEYYDKMNGIGQNHGSRQSSYSYSYSSGGGGGQNTYTYYSRGGGRESQGDYNRQFEDAFRRNSQRNGQQHQQRQNSSLSFYILNLIFEAIKEPFVMQIILVCMLFALLQIAFSIVVGDTQQRSQPYRSQTYQRQTQHGSTSESQYTSSYTPGGTNQQHK